MTTYYAVRTKEDRNTMIARFPSAEAAWTIVDVLVRYDVSNGVDREYEVVYVEETVQAR